MSNSTTPSSKLSLRDRQDLYTLTKRHTLPALPNAAIFAVGGPSHKAARVDFGSLAKNGFRGLWDLESDFMYEGSVTGIGIAPVLCEQPYAIVDLDQTRHPAVTEVKAALQLNRTRIVTRSDPAGVHAHVYFQLPAPLAKAVYSVKDSSGEVLSLRTVSATGEASYVVGERSLHRTGVRYHLERDLPPALLTPSQVTALLEIIGRYQHRAAPAPQSVKPTPPARTESFGNRTNPRVITAIERALESWEGRSLCYSSAMTASLYRNPLRGDDEHRSAYFSRLTGMIHDRATGQYWRTIEVCNYFGIRVADFGGLVE